MDQRKVISLGKSSFAIILPKEWILEHDLKKKDQIFLFTQPDGRIVVQKEREREISVLIKAADDFSPEYLERVIEVNYTLNIDEIIIKVDDDRKFSTILTTTMEIIKNYQGLQLAFEKNEITLTCLEEMEKVSITQIFDGLFNNFKLFLSQIKTGVQLDNTSQIDDIERKYHLGMRYLTFVTQQSKFSEENGVRSNVDVSALKICLYAFRNLILYLESNIERYSDKSKGISESIIVRLESLTPYALKVLRNPMRVEMQQLESEICACKSDFEGKTIDKDASVENLFNSFAETIELFQKAAMSRYFETQQIIREKSRES